MKKSKSLFGRLQNGGLYLRHTVDAGGAFADVYIENRLTKVHQSRLKFCDLCAPCAISVKRTVLIRVHL